MGEGKFEFDGEDITKYLRDVTFDSEVDSGGEAWAPSDMGFSALVHGEYLDIWRRPKHWWSLRREVERWPIRVIGPGDVDEIGAEFAVIGEPVTRMVWRWQGWFEK